MRVDAVRARDFRCYERLDCGLAPGLTVAVGPNGAGKTSLLEAVHFGCLAWSPRTSDETRVVRLGATVTRVEVDAELDGERVEVAVGFEPGRPKRLTVDGAPLASADELARRFAVLVFTPDRLAVVKGAPAIRRRYLDRAVARLWPRFGRIAADYARAVQQRNHLLRRIRAGGASRDALSPWDGQVAQLGAEVRLARQRLIGRLQAPFAEHLALLGGAEGPIELVYEAAEAADATVLGEVLARSVGRDVERGQTTTGPHLDDLVLREGLRDVRVLGSQGEQRSAVLALLLAEADLVRDTRGLRPLLLLDDVASELDAGRRRRLLESVAERGQAVVTATDASELGVEPDLVLAVSSGQAAPA